MAAKASVREIYARERESLILQIQKEQEEKLANIDERCLIWLALVPAWTLALARACDFPHGAGASIEETLKQVEAAGYCRSSRFWPEDEEFEASSEADLQSFWMPNEVRTEVLQNAVQSADGGLLGLQQEIQGLSVKIKHAQEQAQVTFPDGVKRWAELALMAEDTGGIAAWLDEKIEQLLEAGESGQVLHWIEVARPLEELLGSELTISIGRGVRRLELYHRLADDQRRLVKFLERDEQLQAFIDLLKDDSHEWALHYIGSGGVGKTMLIRYLTAYLAPRLKLSTARVDFDYLNPDYPARAPGLLMAQLAEELRVYDDTGAAARLFASFIEKVMNLHERLGAATVWSQFSLGSVMGPVYEALPLFIDALVKLPQPVVIILDTCEELSKIRVDGTIPPSVEATFGLLEHLHDMLPSIRVVFGGRRPLASKGAGWSAPASQLPPRPYLRAHEILGFTFEESTKYLRRIEGVREEAVKPIIKHSASNSDRRHLTWNISGQPLPQIKRYNPFDLSLYATWLREDPELTLEAIRTADADRYIDMRIVRRIKHPDLLSLLPVMALMGRCDYNTLRVVSGLETGTFNNIFIELSNLEWVSRQHAQMIEMDRGLRPRLLAYMEHTRPQQLETVRRAVVAHMERATIEDERSQLDASHFSTTFRLLSREPQRALAWWERAERRLADEEAYDWLKSICELIMGEEEEDEVLPRSPDAVEPAARLMRAAVRVSYAAAMTHVGAFDKIEAVWAEAVAYAEKYPVAEESARLMRRARAGRLAASSRYSADGPPEGEVQWLWQTLREIRASDLDTLMTGSLVAAAEAVLEFLDARRPNDLLDPAPLIHFSDILSAPGGYAEPARFAAALTGRLCGLLGRREEGLTWFRRAIRGVSDSAGGTDSTLAGETSAAGTHLLGDYETAQTWLDWRAPAHIGSRVRLEFIRYAYPTLSAADVLAEVEDKIPEPTNVDSDRLGSAVLYLRSTSGLRFSSEMDDYAGRSRYGVQHEPTCLAHQSFPPLFACVAEAMSAGGAVDGALTMLQQESIAAEAAVTQFASVQEADRACLRISRRMRLRDEDIGVSTSVQSSEEFADLKLRWAIGALSNPKQELSLNIESTFDGKTTRAGRPSVAHERFRTSYALYPGAVKLLADWMTQAVTLQPPTADTSFEELQCILDAIELNECNRRINERRPFPQFRVSQIRKTRLWQDTGTSSMQRLILLLRHAALDTSKETILQIDKKLVSLIGYRRAALIALEEGELLALRLPDRAARLLDQAYRWFDRANDPVGASLSKICSALAVARVGNNAALARALNKIQSDYTAKLSNAVRALPKWPALKALAENPQSKTLDSLTPRGWRPWLIRLVACLAWQGDGYRLAGRTEKLKQWLEANYGVASNRGVTLPAEMEGWLTSEADPAQVEQAELTLSITKAKPSNAWRALLEPAMEVSLALQGREQQIKQSGIVEGLRPYRSAAELFFAGLGESTPLVKVITALARQNVIQLEVDHLASWVCWEAVVGLGIQNLLGTEDEIFHFQRRVRESKTRRFASWDKVRHALSITNDLHMADAARSAWAGLVYNLGFLHEIRDTDPVHSRKHNTGNPGVLHVIGTPTETSAGVRLDLSSERHRRQGRRGAVGGAHGSGGSSGGRSSGGGSTGGSGGSTGGRGELLRAEFLVSLMPNMAMCILQATSSLSGDGERTQTDREQAAYLRHLGAEVFRLGVPVVITIPALAAGPARDILKTILHSFLFFNGEIDEALPALEVAFPDFQLPKKRWTTAEAIFVFLKTIADAQAFIKETSGMLEEEAFEAALDICLYAADVKT